MSFPRTLLFLLIVASSFAGRVEALAELTADINLGYTGRSSGDPADFARLGSLSYFRACERVHGCELWQSDGSAAGTVMLADICPGPCSSNPSHLAITYGSTLYFAADDGEHGIEPWQYRPALIAPRMVDDVNPGADGSSPFGFSSVSSTTLAGVFFVATIGDRPDSANAIFRATESTNTVNASVAIAPGTLRNIGALVLRDDRFYFRALSDANGAGTEMWTMHGPTEGTYALTFMRDIFPGVTGSTIDQITPVPSLNLVFFRALDSSGNSELWKTNGTAAGTVLVKEISSAGGSFPDELTVLGNRLYFFANDAATSYGNNRELWVSDGTSAGTKNVIELRSGSAGSNPLKLRVLGNRLIFIADNGSSGQEFFSSDGTAAGTALVTDLTPGTAGLSPYSYDSDAVIAGGFYYLGSDTRLFRTDGTAAGSRQVGQTFDDLIIGFRSLHAAANSVMFNLMTFSEGAELYQSRFDSPSEANLLRVIGDQIGHSDPELFYDLPGGRIVMAYDDVDGFEWRRLDPAGGATILVELLAGANTNSPLSAGAPVRSTSGADRLWFVNNFNELWLTDGSVAGTRKVFDFSSLTVPLGVSCLAARGDQVIVQTRNYSPARIEVWLSDGTEAGTQSLLTPENIPFDTVLGDIFCPVAAGDAILVSASRPGTGREMFRSNGTPGNLTLLRDFVAGTGSAFANELIAIGGLVYFRISDESGNNNSELWRSDGTSQGTLKLGEINPTGSSNPRGFTAFGNELLFIADDGSHGFEPYRSDGTVAGTSRIVDLFDGPGSSVSRSSVDRSPMVVDATGRIFFSAIGGYGFGRDLYVSDGTQAGTRRVSPDSATQSVQPQGLVALADGGVLFAGYSPEAGRELWFSDGSDEGTFLITDIVPGPESGGPQQLTATADGALFAANDGVHGLEPWRLVLTRESPIFADGFER